MAILEVKDLEVYYGVIQAIKGISFEVNQGEIIALIGANGAGKSTTMKMLLGLTSPTGGSFTVDGGRFPDDRISILKKVGSFIESPSFYANLTGWENLDIIRRILGLPESAVNDALDLVGLAEFGNRLAKKYSLGMKQRLGLAGALLGRPPILILDEPTRGIDVGAKYEIYCIINQLVAEGKTVEEIGKQLGMRPEEVFRLSDFSREDFLKMMVKDGGRYSSAEFITKL